MATVPVRMLRAALAFGAVLALALVNLVVPEAQAAACTLTVDTPAANADGSYTISGSLRETGNNAAAPNVPITITVSGGGSQSTTTDNGGRYSALLANLSVGSHNITVTSGGTAQCASTSKSTSVTASGPQLNAKADPTSIAGGESVIVSGVLVYRGAAIAGAWIEVSTAVDRVGDFTNEDGSFQMIVGGPSDCDTNSFLITVSYSGEGSFPAASQQISIGITSCLQTIGGDPGGPVGPEPTETWTPPASASPKPTASPTASRSATTRPPAAPIFSPGSPAMIILTVFAIVIFIAAGTLLVIAVVSRQRRGLAADERRGFGSDFGQRSRAKAKAPPEITDAPETEAAEGTIIDELPPDQISMGDE